ncbi:MAG: Gfo/Idh/MocA family oxidoreductase [Candidatus Latescibacteria bacterium]|nr:Gfo/Idh/MocA family oxidoreductase [Candidatus Latescibacterota bacterium]MCK5526286.1 Gfo/Idh/MocA family oxidoreductase [Candidatus Latescibacterota bacterium]
MAKIGVGVIGSGGIAQGAHLPGYAALEDEVEIVACCDVDEKVAKAAAERFGAKKVFTDYRDMLALKDIQAVSVCTPNFMHKTPTIAALKAGKHVLCEKPIAMNAIEGAAMCRTAKETGMKLMVGQNNRFRSDVQALKRQIDAEKFGEIYYARAQALRRRGIPGWGVFCDKEKQGGGPLVDIGVHALDLTWYLMGMPKPIAASGKTYTKFGTRDDVVGLMGQWDPKTFTVEDFAVGFIRFDNGATAIVESSFCANIDKDIFSTALFGTSGGGQLSPIRIFTEENGTLFDVTPVHLPEVKTHHREIELFIEAIRNDTEVPVPGEQALEVMKMLDAIYQSSERDKEVKIK